MKLRVPLLVLAALLLPAGAPAQTSFDWSADPNVVRGASAFSLEADGITATAEAYVAEWNGSGYDVLGPLPTSPFFTSMNPDGFVLGAEGLLLEEGSIGGVMLSGDEACSGGGCGFDNGFYAAPPESTSIEKFNFALIAFDAAVDIETVLAPVQSNLDFDFWVLSGGQAPDLELEFAAAFTGFAASLHDPDPSFQGASGLSGVHQAVRYLAIGVPANTGNPLGLINPDPFRDSIAIGSVTVLPEPASPVLLGAGAGMLLALSRHRRHREGSRTPLATWSRDRLRLTGL